MHQIAAVGAMLTLTIGFNVTPALPQEQFISQTTLQALYQSMLAQESPSPVTGIYDPTALSALDNTSRGWGQGNRVDDKNRPLGAVQAQQTYGQYNASFLAEESPLVYLTLDEGYENGYTGKILDVLQEKQCPAVFFVTLDYVKQNPDLVRRMIDEGHVVGNHSVSHPAKGLPSLSIDRQAEELMALHRYMQDNFDYDMYLFRYPAGIYSTQSLALVQQLGYRSVFWSFAYQDWVTDKQPEPKAALKTITGKLHPGAIYLLHAVSSTNTQIMGDFIDAARAQGYIFGKMTAEA